MQDNVIKEGAVVKLKSDTSSPSDYFTVGKVFKLANDSEKAIVYWFEFPSKELKKFEIHTAALDFVR
jgi:hypothetical protein